ncbi:MAG TPA: ATP-binding protein [Candidatus Saccharimonadales bacterium]|nr:ATP-binding protein [Candidatus Saccharimonadales bacterium]
MPRSSSASSVEKASRKTIYLALRWMLLLSAAFVLLRPDSATFSPAFSAAIIALFALSNVALTVLPEERFRTRTTGYLVIIVDTTLVSFGFLNVEGRGSALPLVFFLILLIAAMGTDLLRTVIAATLVSGLYAYLVAGRATGPNVLAGVLIRLPFFCVVSLYYGHLVQRARAEQARSRRIEREKKQLETILEVTAATTSTLELTDVLFSIVSRIARLIDARRCSILQVKEEDGSCRVLASSDERGLAPIDLDLAKYPEVRQALETRHAVVIDDISKSSIMDPCREHLDSLGFQSILVVPILFGEKLLGMLFIRAARSRRPFSRAELTACQVVANASANALQNALMYRAMEAESADRKKAAEQLQNILDQSPDLIFTTDRQGRITEYSRGGKRLLGLTRAEALGTICYEIFPEPEGRARIEALVRSGGSLSDLETVVHGEGGRYRDVIVAGSALAGEGGSACGTVIIVKDISEIRRAKLELMQSEKMTAVGRAVSGVAHELNNPLTAVVGFSQLLGEADLEPKLREAVERIHHSAMRCQNVVRNILAFSRHGSPQKRPCDLNDLVRSLLGSQARGLHGDGPEIRTALAASLPQAAVDPEQMRQVIALILENASEAVEAFGGSGGIEVATRLRGERILLEVTDSGPGIPPDAAGRIFDPFFTTKPAGEGMGLGLTVAYGIVRDHGGVIRAGNVPGRGARFTVELPRCAASPAETPAPLPSPAAGPEPERIRVLAVDDEQVILDLLVAAFDGGTYAMDTATSGEEALRKLAGGRYDVVLLDLRMPGMDGRQLFERIEKSWPDLSRRVVFATGDTACEESLEFLAGTGRPYLHKPYRLEAIESLIVEACSPVAQ